MKRGGIFLLLVLFAGYGEARCLEKSEEQRALRFLEEDEYYADVPNIIDCKRGHEKSSEFKKLCGNKELVLMLEVLSKANVYAYENATHSEVDHRNFNRRHLKFNLRNYIKKDKLDMNRLCYDLKVKTTDLLGGLSPYIEVELMSGKGKSCASKARVIYFLAKNIYGYVLKGPSKRKIYLGKKGDVLDWRGRRGVWYRIDSNKFIIRWKGGKITKGIITNVMDYWEESQRLKGRIIGAPRKDRKSKRGTGQ